MNEGLDEDDQLCPELPAYIRFGVGSPIALELAQAGVRSRRLVHVVAATAATATDLPIREWLRQTDVRTWGRVFDASPSELADLLRFSRARDVRITSRVLAGDVVEIPLVVEGAPVPGAVEVREVDEAPPPRLAAFRDSQVVGYVRSGHHDDVNRLLDIGVPLSISLTEDRELRIRATIRPSARGGSAARGNRSGRVLVRGLARAEPAPDGRMPSGRCLPLRWAYVGTTWDAPTPSLPMSGSVTPVDDGRYPTARERPCR